MTDTPFDTLYDHHARALDLLTRGHDLLEGDKAAALAQLPAIRAEMATVLRAYQVFKHETIFDPAVATGEPECMKLGRAMKIECIAAGEAFRVHGQQWKTEAMAADWPNYRVAARLTLHALRRHLERERAGIERLIAMLQSGLQSGGRCAPQ